MHSIKFKVEFPDSTELYYKSSSHTNYMQSLPTNQSVVKARHPLHNLTKASGSTEDHPIVGYANMSCTIHKGRDKTTQNQSWDMLLQNKERYCNLGLFPKIMIV